MRAAPLILAAVLVPPMTATAQVPRVTWSGDPTVADDTIYALAVDSADRPGESFVYLLDDGVVRVDVRGHSISTYRQVVQILTAEGVERWAELTHHFDAARERLTYNWIRVLDLDGNVLVEGPRHVQEAALLPEEFAPVYTDLVQRRLTLAGLRPGTILDYSLTRDRFDLVAPDDFATRWWITTGALVRRSRLVVDLPVDLRVRIWERNVGLRHRDDTVGDRRVLAWLAHDVPPFDLEPFAAWPNDVLQEVAVMGERSWADVARWAESLFAARAHVSAPVRDAAARVLATAGTHRDSILALHRWVAQDIRYVSLSIGLGSHQPRAPADVVSTGFGDCKDKTTLLVSLLRDIGVTAHPVLVRMNGAVEPDLPSISAFDHMIAAVWMDDTVRFVDATADVAPVGIPPRHLDGTHGLLLDGTARARLTLLPVEAAGDARTELHIVATVDTSGRLYARASISASGTAQFEFRRDFAGADRLPPATRARIAHNWAEQLFAGSIGDSLEVSDGLDLSVPPRMQIVLRTPKALRRAGGVLLLPLPLPTFGSRVLATELEAWGPRRFPIDVDEVTGRSSYSQFKITLPDGWVAELPGDVFVDGVFGTYRSRYVQEGRVVRIERELIGARGRQPPERAADLVSWLRQIAADDVQLVTVRPAPAARASRTPP